MDPFLRGVRATIHRETMIVAGDRVLVAYSGGPDSTALLCALYSLAEELDIQLVAAHFNHGLHAEAGEVERRCGERARSLGIPFVSARSKSLSQVQHNLEAEARRERYRFLHGVAQETGCNKIATGHTRDDQAETVLMRVLRGTGVRGLAGIQPVRADGVIRPLIERSRQEVLSFLRRRGIAFEQDPMNSELRFTRNYIRSRILPELSRLNPDASAALARLAVVARRYEQAVAGLLREHVCALATADDKIDLVAFAKLPRALREWCLYDWLSTTDGSTPRQTLSLARVERLARRLEELASRQHWLSRDEVWALFRDRANPFLNASSTATALSDWGPIAVEIDSWQELPGGYRAWVSRETRPTSRRDRECLLAMDWLAVFDAGAWQTGHWFFRPARPGDRIEPLGMTGSKKLQDVFVDRKVERGHRWGRPVLACDDVILWVPGVVRSRHAVVDPRVTQQVVKVWVAYPDGSRTNRV